MSQLPINPPSPEEQQRIMGQMYLLMGKQVQSYHKHRHMGNNSSVPVELAQELMESIEYTINQVGGVYAHRNLEEALRLGQEILEDKLSKAKSMLGLVSGTSPHWQTEGRWEALRYLRHYLEQYDHLHLAHKGPDDLFYPILISPPEGIQGIDSCLFYLKIMWIENQIMAGVSEAALEEFWDRLPVGTLNQCEYLLINGIGKALLGAGIDPLVFESEEHMQLIIELMRTTEDSLNDAAKLLCQWLNLKDENALMYVEAVIPQLAMWIGDNIHNGNLENIFL
ncbi:MAG: hypothetical protein IJ307_02705 [Bacteroidales bacterium]|nr:hypothetical protein [Bacteroidales bacterium]